MFKTVIVGGMMQRGATIIYATHIFDGLETWATDIAYVEDGELKRSEKIETLEEFQGPKGAKNLLGVVEPWLRNERDERERSGKVRRGIVAKASVVRPADVSPFTSSRQMSYYR